MSITAMKFASSRHRVKRKAQRKAALYLLPWLFLFAGSLANGQVTPEEHQKHHPGQSGTATPGPGGPGGMADMMKMMEHGAPPAKELYPSLMNLSALTPQQRTEIQEQAEERIQSGIAAVGAALDSLSEAAAREDYAAMHEATSQVSAALSRFESGVAAKRALAEGKAPRNVALQWFKREMNLLPPADERHGGGVLGISWFHFFIMLVLVAFAVAMIGMYFFKMRRATALLAGLTGTVESAGAAKGNDRPTAPAAPSAPIRTDTAPLAPLQQKWSGNLRVSRIFQETPDVKTFRLMSPMGGVLPFSYLPGQFLTVAVPIDGKPVKRSYTIASSPTQHDYADITVKHEDGGVVSGFLHDRVQQGDLLEVSGPSGSFIFTGRECKCILLIGGGVGITPLMSVIRYLTDRSWPGDIYLLYSIHSPQDFIFREELTYLQHRHTNLRVTVTVSHPEAPGGTGGTGGTDWKGPTGRITKELITQFVPDLASRYVHLCGPVPMMEAIRKALAELGVPADRIKTEAFGPALGKPEPTKPQAAPAGAGAEPKVASLTLPTATFTRSDKSAPLPPDKTVLDVADEIGVEIDNSCRVGTCGTCRVKLLSGQVTMAVEEGLEPGDKEQGIILACQAKSTGNLTVEA